MRPRLDVKRWIYAAITVFVVYQILEYLANRIIFMPSYPTMFPGSPEGESVMLPRVWMYLGRAIFSFMFAFIYTKGYEGKGGLAEGVRYGFWIALLVPVPNLFRNLVVAADTGSAPLAGMLTSVVEIIIFGALVGLIYRLPPQQSSS